MGSVTVEGKRFEIEGKAPTDSEWKQIDAVLRSAQKPDAMPEFAPQGRAGRSRATDEYTPERTMRERALPPIPDEYKPTGTPREIAEDMMVQGANAASLTFAPKLSAKIGEWQGKGSYDELLAKRRKEIEEGASRLGLPATILANLSGGAGLGSVLSRLPALWRGGIAGGTTAVPPGLTVAGRVAGTAPISTKVGAGALEGAGYGAVQGAGSTDTGRYEDYVTNMLKGGGIGAAFGGVIPLGVAATQKAITPFPSTDPVRAGMVQTLEGAGVPVSAGRSTGNKTLELFEDTVAKLPFGRRATGDVDPMERVTAAAMRHAGIGGGSRATPEVLDGAFTRIGSDINNIQRRYPVPVDDRFLNTVARVEGDVLPLVQQNNQGIVRYFIDRLTSGQQIAPQEAQALRTQLTQSMRDFMGSNTDSRARAALLELREGLDDALTRTINRTEAANRASGAPRRVGDADEMDRLRRQYANLHVLTDAISSSGKQGDAGILTPAALEGAVSRSVGKVEAARGGGDLNELAKASNYLLSGLPDSFTATREGLLNPFKAAASPILNRAVTGPTAQSYWGNQSMPQRAAPGYVAPAVGGMLGPADRLMQGLLMRGP